MAGPNTRVTTADRQAAEWHARLGVRSVSTETLEAFFLWRAEPANADAYRRVEAIWARSQDLSDRPGIRKALDEAMTRKVRPGLAERYGRTLFAAATVTAVAVLGVAVWFWSARGEVLSTGVGEQRVVQLADGSTVRLDTGSAVRVRMGDAGRRLVLERGQALFTVAHDPARPFVVEAGGTEVAALGTVFDVRRMGGTVRVTLVEGVVQVSGPPGSEPTQMRAGEQARVTLGSVRTTPVDVKTATSWTDGRLIFADTPLGEAVAEVNRYLKDPVVLGEGVDGRTPVNGVFRAGDRSAFASAAAAGLGLDVVGRADGSLLLSGRKK